MCVKEWKRIAEWEAVHYRERKAFLKGVEDAAGKMTPRAAQYRRWVEAVENLLVHLERTDPERARFFRLLYGLDGGRKQYDKKGLVSLTFSFHAAQSTLYQWRNEVLSLLLIAAAETGALKPFRSETGQ
ncbi:MAG: hypothetical protein II412_03415 [Clostridia bacterium]|nr:hypothetical protein [Clostridia bacterium]